jgi:hypothetical protein
MDAERSGWPMNDTAIVREIQAALAVDPSPEFIARVRTRIAAEPVTSGFWTRRPWATVLAAVAAGVIAFAVVMSRPRDLAPVGSSARDIELESSLAPVVSGFSRTVDGTAEAGHSGSGSRARKVATVRAEPEILLDPAETRALRRLIAGTRDGSLDLSAALRATTPTAMDLPPIDLIAIAPLTIDPLTPSGEEGVRP